MHTLASQASPETIARRAKELNCRSVAYTYNDPVVFHEYAVDVAKACREQGIASVAVSAGYVCEKPREEFYSVIDAVNIDLKSFNEDFYFKLTGGHLQPVLETLQYLKTTDVWFEITTLLIPGHNDSVSELHAMSEWIMQNLGPDVPLHFSAFHPDWKMQDVPPTPAATLTKAREIAMQAGLHYVYTGNVHDSRGSSTYCPECGHLLIERDWYELGRWGLDDKGCCASCGTSIAGRFEAKAGEWGARRMPVFVGDNLV